MRGQCLPKEPAASLDGLDPLGLAEADLLVDPPAKSVQIVFQAVKYPLDLELLGKPGAGEDLGICPEGRAGARAEGTASELLPQRGAMVGPLHVERDLSVIEAVIVIQPT
jgi:hypothetical protein